MANRNLIHLLALSVIGVQTQACGVCVDNLWISASSIPSNFLVIVFTAWILQSWKNKANLLFAEKLGKRSRWIFKGCICGTVFFFLFAGSTMTFLMVLSIVMFLYLCWSVLFSINNAIFLNDTLALRYSFKVIALSLAVGLVFDRVWHPSILKMRALLDRAVYESSYLWYEENLPRIQNAVMQELALYREHLDRDSRKYLSNLVALGSHIRSEESVNLLREISLETVKAASGTRRCLLEINAINSFLTCADPSQLPLYFDELFASLKTPDTESMIELHRFCLRKRFLLDSSRQWIAGVSATQRTLLLDPRKERDCRVHHGGLASVGCSEPQIFPNEIQLAEIRQILEIWPKVVSGLIFV